MDGWVDRHLHKSSVHPKPEVCLSLCCTDIDPLFPGASVSLPVFSFEYALLLCCLA